MPWKTSCYKTQRWEFIQQFLRQKNKVAELCRRWSISRKTAYKWIGRFKERGRFGLYQRATRNWVRDYNHERPHEALQMAVPGQFYLESSRKMPRQLKHWQYAPGWETRLVKSKGMISFRGLSRFVGEAFEQERVGLKRIRAGVWEVYFGPLLIGELWDCENSGIRAVWYRQARSRK
jgi:transposase-like protein